MQALLYYFYSQWVLSTVMLAYVGIGTRRV